MNSTHIFFSNLNSYAAYIRISIWLKHKASPRKFSSIKQSMMEALDNAHFFPKENPNKESNYHPWIPSHQIARRPPTTAQIILSATCMPIKRLFHTLDIKNLIFFHKGMSGKFCQDTEIVDSDSLPRLSDKKMVKQWIRNVGTSPYSARTLAVQIALVSGSPHVTSHNFGSFLSTPPCLSF